MSLFESTVLLDEVKVITSDNDSALHFHFSDNSGQNTSTKSIFLRIGQFSKNRSSLPDEDITGEGAFFIDVCSLSGFPGNFEAETDLAHVLLFIG